MSIRAGDTLCKKTLRKGSSLSRRPLRKEGNTVLKSKTVKPAHREADTERQRKRTERSGDCVEKELQTMKLPIHKN